MIISVSYCNNIQSRIDTTKFVSVDSQIEI